MKSIKVSHKKKVKKSIQKLSVDIISVYNSLVFNFYHWHIPMGGWRVAWLGVEDDRGLAAVLIRCGVVRLLLPCRHSNNLLTVRDSQRQPPAQATATGNTSRLDTLQDWQQGNTLSHLVSTQHQPPLRGELIDWNTIISTQ